MRTTVQELLDQVRFSKLEPHAEVTVGGYSDLNIQRENNCLSIESEQVEADRVQLKELELQVESLEGTIKDATEELEEIMSFVGSDCGEEGFEKQLLEKLTAAIEALGK